jgi:hypothetical protein
MEYITEENPKRKILPDNAPDRWLKCIEFHPIALMPTDCNPIASYLGFGAIAMHGGTSPFCFLCPTPFAVLSNIRFVKLFLRFPSACKPDLIFVFSTNQFT